MPRLIFKNNFEVALAQPTTTSDTTITIRSGSGFPTLAANERVVATIVDAATGLQFEIVTVTAVVGNVLTVQRAQEGTAARAWAAGDMLSIRTTAATLTNTLRNFGTVPSGMNLNALTGSWFGQYYQNSDGAASFGLNYPVEQAGVLEVLQTGVSTESCIQKYTSYSINNTYQRRFNAQNSTWSPWVMIYSESSIIPVANGGTGQTTIQGMKSAFGFGTVADQNIVPTSMGGTGSADNAQAWLNIRPQGATPLAGDPVNDHDAATKRWVENLVNTGTVGPSMNGVMNYGVGDFHLRDSRAYIQPYEVVADGQLLNRADWPELWAYAQMLSPIADADWLADPAKRGKYSLGNGTTTFRVPDRNGVQTGSIQALFGRGDGGNPSSNGVVSESGAPNITYSAPRTMVTLASAPSQVATNGAFQSITSGDSPAAAGSGSRFIQTNFDASRSSPVYGRSAAEIVPRNFVGVWVIRASGGFVAANTQWSVINADSVRPGSGVKGSSGQVRAQYKIGTVVEADAGLRCDAYMDGFYYAILSVYNKTKGVTKDLAFDDAGTLSSDRFAARYGSLMSWSETGTRIGTYATVRQSMGQNYAFNSLFSGGQQVDTGYATTLHHGLIHNNNGSFAQGTWLVVGDDNAQYQTRMNIQPNSHDVFFSVSILGSDSFYTLQKNAISDENLKHDIQPGTVEKAWSNLSSLEYVTFIYNNDEKERVRRGVIAQQAEIIDPLYVKTVKFYPSEGVEVEQKQLDTTPMLLDTMHVVQELMKKVESLEAEIAALKSAK
ncbi:tail fiber domain-containing protein [Escherichia coli]|nr:tail fiber domain-containing protein [Escherichia coli]